MANETIWLLFVTLDLTAALIAIRLYGKVALYAIIIVNMIICNLQVLKLVDIFGFTMTLGNIAYCSVFMATDLLVECYGKAEARKAINLSLLTLVFVTIALHLTVSYKPSIHDIHHPAMAELFTCIPRVTVASILSYWVAQYHDIWAFNWWKIKTQGRHLWLRNNASTMVSQLIDTAVFTLLAFYGDYNVSVIWSVFATTVVIKWMVVIINTPAVYFGRWLLQSSRIEKEQNLTKVCYL